VQTNKHGMLIMRLIAVTSIGNKTKHTFTVQKKNFTAVNIGISIGHRNFLPKYWNISHWKFCANCL